ncbi:hypothetical protein QEN19_000553 [Hanseniaspora menglaensis]
MELHNPENRNFSQNSEKVNQETESQNNSKPLNNDNPKKHFEIQVEANNTLPANHYHQQRILPEAHGSDAKYLEEKVFLKPTSDIEMEEKKVHSYSKQHNTKSHKRGSKVWSLPHFFNANMHGTKQISFNVPLPQTYSQLFNGDNNNIRPFTVDTSINADSRNQRETIAKEYLPSLNKNMFSQSLKSDVITPQMPYNINFLNSELQQREFYGKIISSRDAYESNIPVFARYNNSHTYDSIREKKQVLIPQQLTIPDDDIHSIPISLKGKFEQPLFLAGSSLFSPIEFSNLVPDTMISSVSSFYNRPIFSNFNKNTFGLNTAINQENKEVFSESLQTICSLNNENQQKIANTDLDYETLIKIHEEGIKPQLLNFNAVQKESHQIPAIESRNTDRLSCSNFLNDQKTKEAVLVPNLIKAKVAKPKKSKPEPINLDLKVPNIIDADEVLIDYEEPIYDANINYDSFQLPNPFTSPFLSTNSLFTEKGFEEGVLAKKADVTNLLPIQEKALEVEINLKNKDDYDFDLLLQTGSDKKVKKHKKSIFYETYEKKAFKRTKKPAPILINEKEVVLKQKVDNQVNHKKTAEVQIETQYLEADSNNILTKSTKQVIDQIKQDALNGKNNQLISFSPINLTNYSINDSWNSALPQPILIHSAKYKSSSSSQINSVFSDLELSAQLKKLNKISPFDVNFTEPNQTENFKQFLSKKYDDFEKPQVSKSSIKSKKNSNNNSVTSALQSTMNAIIKSSQKKKIKNSIKHKKLNDLPKLKLENTSCKIEKSGIKTLEKNSAFPFAQTTDQSRQFVSLPQEGKKISFCLSSISANNMIDSNNGAAFMNINSVESAANLNLEQPIMYLQEVDIKSIDKIRSNNDFKTENSPNSNAIKVVNKLENIFKNKQKNQRKQLINISTQLPHTSNSLVVKTDDMQNETAVDGNQRFNNLNKYEKSAEALLNDPNFTIEQLNKSKKGLFSCLHCSSKFVSVLEYAIHLDTVDFERPFKCPFNDCYWKYLGMTTPGKLRRHCALQHMSRLNNEMKKILNIKDNSYPEISCPELYCDKVFMRKDSIARHLQMAHKNFDSRFNQRLRKVLDFIASNFSHLIAAEQNVLIKEYMNGSLIIPSSSKLKAKKRDLVKRKQKEVEEEQEEQVERIHSELEFKDNVSIGSENGSENLYSSIQTIGDF